MKRLLLPTTIEENLITYQETIFGVLESAKAFVIHFRGEPGTKIKGVVDSRDLINSISELVANLKRPEAWKTVNESYVVTSNETAALQVFDEVKKYFGMNYPQFDPDQQWIINKIDEIELTLKSTINEFHKPKVNPDRLKIATQILVGLVSNYTLKDPEDQDTLTELSFQLADNLIKKSKV